MTNLVSQMEQKTYIETLQLVVAADKSWGKKTTTSILMRYWLEFLTGEATKEETLARFNRTFFSESDLRQLNIGGLQSLCYMRMVQEVEALKAS